LHIGSHKTGSSSIQYAMAANKASLKDSNLTLFSKGPDGENVENGNMSCWVVASRLDMEAGQGGRVKSLDRLKLYLAELSGDVVLSAEHFSFLFDQQEIARLYAMLSELFDTIKVIVYLRRQDQQVISLHQQGSKVKNGLTAFYLGNQPCSMPAYSLSHRLYLDYYERLTKWALSFGYSNLNIRVFEEESLISGDVVDDFFQQIGAKAPKESVRINVSNGFERTKVGHLINESMSPSSVSTYLRKRASNQGRLLPKECHAREYYLNYVKSNQMLNEKFKVNSTSLLFSDDFSLYPSEETCDLWTETSANKALLNILSGIDDVFGFIGADDLRDAALALEDENVELSYKFMSAAFKMRPQGDFIRRKVLEYSNKIQGRS